MTLLQFMEALPDRQAADALRSRIDWENLLILPLIDPGFDSAVLCESSASIWLPHSKKSDRPIN